jgi:hypothetical protein
MDTKRLESILEEDGIVFLTYGGFLTQSLIVGMTEALEMESKNSELNMTTSNNIFTIFIELSQNMMNYSKAVQDSDKEIDPKGMIIVGKNSDNNYYILSQNILNLSDKEKMEPKLKEILASDLETIKKLYKEARRSGRDKHHRGGGIGFYEIAKRAKKIEYNFTPIKDDKFYFKFKVIL